MKSGACGAKRFWAYRAVASGVRRGVKFARALRH